MIYQEKIWKKKWRQHNGNFHLDHRTWLSGLGHRGIGHDISRLPVRCEQGRETEKRRRGQGKDGKDTELMLIYGNTPRDIIEKIQSKLNGKGNMKKIIFVAVIVAVGYFGLAKADTNTTPQELISKVKQVPERASNFISGEVEKTKIYQKKQWAEAKAQWSRLISKFQAN